jgi:hypothetical protein
MQNYSVTQAANITAFAGFIVLILNRFGLNLIQSDVELLLGALLTAGGILWNWIHRQNKGDVAVSGFKKTY